MNITGRVAASVLCAAIPALLPAQEQGHPVPGKPVASAPATQPKFVVVKTGDKLEVMTSEQLDATNKRLADDYKRAMKRYEEDRRAAAEEGETFDGQPPVKVTATAVGTTHATREAADAALKKIKEEAAEKEAKEKTPAPPKKDGGH